MDLHSERSDNMHILIVHNLFGFVVTPTSTIFLTSGKSSRILCPLFLHAIIALLINTATNKFIHLMKIIQHIYVLLLLQPQVLQSSHGTYPQSFLHTVFVKVSEEQTLIGKDRFELIFECLRFFLQRYP